MRKLIVALVVVAFLAAAPAAVADDGSIFETIWESIVEIFNPEPATEAPDESEDDGGLPDSWPVPDPVG